MESLLTKNSWKKVCHYQRTIESINSQYIEGSIKSTSNEKQRCDLFVETIST